MKLQRKMEGIFFMLRHKYLFFFLIFTVNIFARDILIANKNIAYKSLILNEDLSLVSNAYMKKYCEPISLDMIQNNKYISNRFIKKNTVVCKDDVSLYKKNSVIFNFGSIQIERNGKLIFENDEYIKIKKENGDIEKIYKDGRIE